MTGFEYDVKWNHFSKCLESRTSETAEMTIHFKPLAHIRGTKTSSASSRQLCYTHSHYIPRFFFLAQFPSRNVFCRETQPRAQKSRTAYCLSCIRPDPCPGAPMRCISVDLMEFMSECVFAVALSGSGP